MSHRARFGTDPESLHAASAQASCRMLQMRKCGNLENT